MQRSQEAALSITKLTPTSSSASSSDSCEMTSPDPSDDSRLCSNGPELLSTTEDRNSSFEKSVFCLVLNSTQNSPSESEAFNASLESMDCHYISNDCTEDSTTRTGSMDIGSPLHNSNQLSITWNSTPDCSPVENRRTAVRRLASTPEGRHIKYRLHMECKLNIRHARKRILKQSIILCKELTRSLKLILSAVFCTVLQACVL